ncbi:hypothetical protein AAF712_011645 [Marasmius tenuissimus]|uniref:Uncharacterized protein n=1 Tax=Marasmius tenuissimus TaxID=585030 RepID=A0ABR2ZIM7_9AGAR
MTSDLGTKSITYNDRDTRVFNYGGSWFQDGNYSSTQFANETGTLTSTNDPFANVTFTFPMPAIAFHYYGVPRSGGALYGICIDCEPNNMRFQDVDALDTLGNGLGPSVALFSKVFDTPEKHVIILRNQNDTRIVPKGNSQMTIDRFVLDVYRCGG